MRFILLMTKFPNTDRTIGPYKRIPRTKRATSNATNWAHYNTASLGVVAKPNDWMTVYLGEKRNDSKNNENVCLEMTHAKIRN